MRNSRPDLAKRCRLTEGIHFDFDDIFNHVVKWTIIWIFVGLAAIECWAIEHLDMKNKILQGGLTKGRLHHPTNQLLIYPTNNIRYATSNKPSTNFAKLL